MFVPPGHYYEVTAASGALATWHEYAWTVPVVKSLNLGSSFAPGQTRTITANSQGGANTGSAGATATSLQTFINDGGRVRFVQYVGSTSVNSNGIQFRGGDNSVPPFQIQSQCNQGSSADPRHVWGIILPGKTYTIWDFSNGGTPTNTSWFEYDIG
jgi:hypothetical protein